MSSGYKDDPSCPSNPTPTTMQDHKTSPLFLTACFLLSASLGSAQGVMIHDATTGGVLQLTSNHVHVDVEDQIAIITTTQRFLNNTTAPVQVKYAYPLPGPASPTRIRWMYPDSLWHTASMLAQPQDTTLPGSGPDDVVAFNLTQYLGATPLYFKITEFIDPGSWVVMELTYVQLLPYANARVEMISSSNYSTVDNTPVAEVEIEAIIRSQRALTGIDVSGTGAWDPLPGTLFTSADSAYLQVHATQVPANFGFAIGYDLDPLAYGLTALSNFLPDSLAKCDGLPNGFFVLLIEPEPTSEVVPKDFVIIIDRSGSMAGSRIGQARDAASFMVNHLNLGDSFNVIAFSSDNARWSSGLQPFNAANMTSALNWINQVEADGMTNINGAVSEGIQNFTNSSDQHARSLVFLTDGQDNTTSTQTILTTALQLRQSLAPDLQLFTFGIGDGFNEQLLNQLAAQNNGVCQFLAMGNFAEVLNNFYTQIQDPVLMAPVATFDHPDIGHLLPDPLIGLYVGQQLVLAGRYEEPGPVSLDLSGTSMGTPVSFNFSFDLTGTFDESKLFIPKIWAQQAIQAMVNEYYSYPENSSEAVMLRDSIISFSLCNGIGSPFTSFADMGDDGSTVGIEESPSPYSPVPDVIVFPEPSLAGAPVTFDLTSLPHGQRTIIHIFDAGGRLIRSVNITEWAGGYWAWDGKGTDGQAVQGVLYYRMETGTTIHAGRFTRL